MSETEEAIPRLTIWKRALRIRRCIDQEENLIRTDQANKNSQGSTPTTKEETIHPMQTMQQICQRAIPVTREQIVVNKEPEDTEGKIGDRTANYRIAWEHWNDWEQWGDWDNFIDWDKRTRGSFP